jgi:hypothetical protein
LKFEVLSGHDELGLKYITEFLSRQTALWSLEGTTKYCMFCHDRQHSGVVGGDQNTLEGALFALQLDFEGDQDLELKYFLVTKNLA